MHRTEEHQLCPGSAQAVQRFGVGKAECLILCHSNADARRLQSRRRHRGRSRSFGQRFQRCPVQICFQRIGQQADLLGKIGDLSGGFQAQMAALHHRLRQAGQIPQHRQAGLGFQQGLEHPEELFGAVIQQDACNVALRFEMHKALDLCGQRHTGPLGLYHQQYRQVQRIGQLPGTGAGGQALPIVKTHGPFAHHSPVPGSIVGVQFPYRIFGRKIKIQIVALHPQHRPVKHGVDVVRPALEGAGVHAPLFQRGQQGAGDGGLAAAGTRCGDDELHHLRSPVIRKMGLLAVSRWSLPAGLVRLTASWVTSAERP